MRQLWARSMTFWAFAYYFSNPVFRKLKLYHLLVNVNLWNIKSLFYVFFGPASARSYKIGVVGNNWLVGNAVFSKTAPRIFLIFCIMLGDYKGRKVTELGF